MTRIFLSLLIVANCGSLHAAPLVHFALEGRAYGSSDPFTGNVQVQLGDTIEYRLRLLLGQPTVPIDQIPRILGTTQHGVHSLSLDIVQDPAADIQIDFSESGVLGSDSVDGAGDGWNRGIGAGGGTPEARSSLLGRDLLGIRPVHKPGFYSGWDWETVVSGTFSVASIAGATADVQPRWGPNAGGFFMDGKNHFILTRNETGPDRLSHFTPLTLTAANLHAVPEPSSIVLFAAALIGLAYLRRKRA